MAKPERHMKVRYIFCTTRRHYWVKRFGETLPGTSEEFRRKLFAMVSEIIASEPDGEPE